MINADKVRMVLEAEKAKLEAYMEELNKLRAIVGKHDGKIYNKRIREAIREEGFTVCHDGSCYCLVIYGKAYKSDKSLFWARTKDMFCNEKRFSSAKFRQHLWNNIQEARKKLAGIESDLIDTEKKLYEVHQAARYYAEMVNKFSGYTQSEFQQSFELDRFKINNDF